MQSTQVSSCRQCDGKKVVNIGGKEMKCQACRGSGRAADYSTK